MSQTMINAKITDRRLELYNLPLLASGGVEDIMIRCEFCELWDGYGKTAVFYRKGGPVYHATVYETDITVPWEVMTEPGVVFFGIMGVAENTRTTEVVRLTVEQGAITTATATPKEPTPDIYKQLLASYGKTEAALQVERARIDNMIAAHPGGGVQEFQFSDGTVEGSIISNGVMASLTYTTINDSRILQPGESYSITGIAAEFAPLYSVEFYCSNSDLVVEYKLKGGWGTGPDDPLHFPDFVIYNASNAPIALNGQHGSGSFALCDIQIAELQDARVGADGTTYGSAGTAVREQFAQMKAEKASTFYSNLADAIAEENAVADSASPVEVFTSENGEKVVRLLADVSESAQIDISTDINLVLNGHSITLASAGAYLNFGKGTSCTINGEAEGSTIKKIFDEGSAVYIINTDGDLLRVKGGSYSLEGTVSATNVIIFRAAGNCKKMELLNCNAHATTTDPDKKTTIKCVQSQAAELFISGVDFSVESKATAVCMHVLNKVQIENSNVKASGYSTQGINVSNSKTNVTCRNTSITAICTNEDTSSTKSSAYGVQNLGACKLEKCTVYTDAISSKGDKPCAIGVVNSDGDTLVCIDTNVTGTHSGLENHGNLYVTGGTFNGYSHGGFYLIHSPENEVYINNAVMQFGNYEGRFTYPRVDADGTFEGPLAGFYFGLGHGEFSQGISVYMDGCTIEGQGAMFTDSEGNQRGGKGEIFVVRDAVDGAVNTLYISNTINKTVNIAPVAPMKIRIEKPDPVITQTAELIIGMGCNFTPDDTSAPEWAEETGKLYRRMKDEMPMDSRDFNALIAYLDK